MYIGSKTPDGVWRNTLLNLSWHTFVILQQHIANASHKHLYYPQCFSSRNDNNALFTMRHGSHRSPYSPLSARQKTSEKKTAGSIQLVARLSVSTLPRIQSRLLSFVPASAPSSCYNAGRDQFKRAWRNTCHCPTAIDCPTL